jgi:hypothetical protein
MRLPPPPPPSRSNASGRWFFRSVSTVRHHHHLPRVQTRAGGGFFDYSDRPPPPPPPSRPNASWRWFLRLFRPPATTTTSLAFKRELEVVFFVVSTVCRYHHLPRVQTRAGGGFFVVSTVCHHHHLPRVQTRAGGGFLWLFQHVRRHHLPCVQTRAGGGYFRRSNATPTATSLASKCELEVVIFRCFDATQDDWEGHEGGGARGDDDLLVVVPWSSHQRDPLLFVRGFSSMASTKGWCSYHMPPHSIFFSFCSQQYVFRLYTIKIVTTTP